jgi:hypothetical protein
MKDFKKNAPRSAGHFFIFFFENYLIPGTDRGLLCSQFLNTFLLIG